MENIDVGKMSSKELRELSKQVKTREAEERNKKREAYEFLKDTLLMEVEHKLDQLIGVVNDFHRSVSDETGSFYEVMKEYGMLQKSGQESFTIKSDTFQIDVKQGRNCGFDERADIAAQRLIEYLNGWISTKTQGESNPMYKLAMTLLERNRDGDFDQNSISKLYDMESDFNDPEFSDIMTLFTESRKSYKTKFYFGFAKKQPDGRWKKIEPSFNRL